MNRRGGVRKISVRALDVPQGLSVPTTPTLETSAVEIRQRAGALFTSLWYAGNALLILAVLVALYACVWEYSTRRYLKGFSDAVVPAASSDEEKAEAILRWMSTGPARRPADRNLSSPDRDPADTLNYASLLRVCGSATNAFVNLADSAGLSARRLLLLDSRRATKHVVAEVLIDGRWIVVDPAFRTILRGSDGGLLTKEQLKDAATFYAATHEIPGYSPNYTFDRTAHVRAARLGWIGSVLRTGLNRLFPGWEDSTSLSLLMERESLDTLVFAIALVFLMGLVRVAFRWHGERKYGIHPIRLRRQVRRAFHGFMDVSD
jgi:hypothetical protein